MKGPLHATVCSLKKSTQTQPIVGTPTSGQMGRSFHSLLQCWMNGAGQWWVSIFFFLPPCSIWQFPSDWWWSQSFQSSQLCSIWSTEALSVSVSTATQFHCSSDLVRDHSTTFPGIRTSVWGSQAFRACILQLPCIFRSSCISYTLTTNPSFPSNQHTLQTATLAWVCWKTSWCQWCNLVQIPPCSGIFWTRHPPSHQWAVACQLWFDHGPCSSTQVRC